jgi:IS66 Orf2 like protein
MLSLSPTIRIWLSAQPADLRKSIDSLAALVRDGLRGDPLSGDIFVFRNKAADRIKLLVWEEDGYAIWYKKQEEDYPHCAGFTGIGRHLHNLLGWPAQAGGLDSRPSRCGSGRYSMSRATALIAPPRPCRSSSRGRSTDSGVF